MKAVSMKSISVYYVLTGLSTYASVAGYHEQSGAVFATPGIAEKGYLDVRLEVSSPGGHSSVPPAHTVRASYMQPVPRISR